MSVACEHYSLSNAFAYPEAWRVRHFTGQD